MGIRDWFRKKKVVAKEAVPAEEPKAEEAPPAPANKPAAKAATPAKKPAAKKPAASTAKKAAPKAASAAKKPAAKKPADKAGKQCAAITASGKQCSRSAAGTGKYCGIHKGGKGQKKSS